VRERQRHRHPLHLDLADEPAEARQLLKLNKNDANCIAKGWVDKIGTDSLQKYGVLDQDMKVKRNGMSGVKMSPADANKAADVIMSCTDVKAMVDQAMSQTPAISAAVKACVDKAFTRSAAHQMFAAVFSGNQHQATNGLTAKLMKCAMGSSPPR
jgi:fructose-specific phosphotransferase system component IIB